SGLLSICIQHEVDHLDGKVFVDYLSQLKRDRIRTRLVREFNSSEHSIPRKSKNSIAS
ncbi:MAG: peptide deformylase, partial [Proteobacteria bacterium]|nr:peptide deformylase [Pseudomonadota bacterium]